MSCPNCGDTMQMVTFNNQIILHCSNCGASFFEENGINRITLADAEALSLDKKTDEVLGSQKICPKDKTVLKPISTNSPTTSHQPPITNFDIPIPPDVTLLRCPKCHGIFAFPEDLINFKKAQEAKINYFKTWHIPLPALQTVVVLSFIAVVSLTVFSRFILFDKDSIGNANASDLIKKIYLSQSSYYRFISFTTTVPLKAKIVLKNTQGKTIEKINHQSPTTAHYFTISDFPQTDEVYYQIILIDENGKEVKTDIRKLDF